VSGNLKHNHQNCTFSAIVLCGGLGSRLGELTRDTPKPLLDVAGRPFIFYVLDQIAKSGIKDIILAVGFYGEKVESIVGNFWLGATIRYSYEFRKLGTGGAIKLAFINFNLNEAIVVNGDTLLVEDYSRLFIKCINLNLECGMYVKKMQESQRFGRVILDSEQRIINFEEKKVSGAGYINTGVYYLKKGIFIKTPESFSFEDKILKNIVHESFILGLETNNYFIDMGVPEDLQRASSDLINTKI